MAKRTVNRAYSNLQGREHALATKRNIVRHLNKAMIERQKTKQALAQELQTSRSQLARLFDPENIAVSLETIARAVGVLGKRIIFLVEDVDSTVGLAPETFKKSVSSVSVQIAPLPEIEEAAS